MRKKNIILTGFMGTGKSSLGRLLARKLHYKFVDTDQLIEERIGKTITKLFADEGESVFRNLETELTQELANRQGLVIATGGGLMMNPKNATTLGQTGQILCLVATAEEILERISRRPDSRPLLNDPNPLQKITELLQERATAYNKFTQVSTSGQNHHQLVDKLLSHIENRA